MVQHEMLAGQIRQKFTPLAFTCECEGNDPTCAAVRQNPSMIATNETINRIVAFILDQGHQHD
jgi:hypothetical protein